MNIWKINGRIATEIAKAMNRGKKLGMDIKCWQLPDSVSHKMTILLGYKGDKKDLIMILKPYIFKNCSCTNEKLVLEPVEEKKNE